MVKSEIIDLQNIWKTYKMGEVEVNALRGVSLAINQGEFVAITGASGSGKSTMMNLVGCLDLPTKGIIYLDSKDISQLGESELAQIRGKKIGFIFQQFHLIPTLSAVENVMLPLEFQDIPTDTAKKKATEILHKVGLGDRIEHLPSQLSGGEQQRVAIARSLSNNPDVILADEPTGNLDSIAGANVLNLLQTLWKKEGKTIIMVTHDLKLASHAKRIVQLKDGQILKSQNFHQLKIYE
ncbi:ABC transporter ATP-binding protein [Candidatus Woesearchaeota archaeon]|nr:ABC transporter ATP-binding protein [Candidatus Woesearchaeota archaeon]